MIKQAFGWLLAQFVQDNRENQARAYELIIKNSMHLNQIILTVSIASLAAIAALNQAVFAPYSVLSFAVVALFILVILFSTINFYLSGIILRDLQTALKQDVFLPFHISKDNYKQRFKTSQKILNILVFGGFCLGLVAFLVLLGFYTLGVSA
ncbi:MAG TPA: hypothetical protein PKD19_03605 [Candidatus Saccharibacteria bacterium]|nr:hypothetical protein [Candidatus Saccharibacteria bacterium]